MIKLYAQKNYCSRILTVIVSIFISILSSGVFADTTVTVDRSGRAIQLDGFLLEWSAKTAKVWHGDGPSWYWDAMNTPEGLAGYFRTSGKDVCKLWTFTLTPQNGSSPYKITIPYNGKDFYRLDTSSIADQKNIIMEWLLPWKEITQKDGSTYRVNVKGLSGCGDTMSRIVLEGSRGAKTSIVTPRLIIQGSIVLVLLIVYFIVRRKFAKPVRRKGAPHR